MVELSNIDRMKIELRTAVDMNFAGKDRRFKTILRFTRCTKPTYTQKIKRYLEWMEEKGFYRPASNPKAVCVKLNGMLRYVWRTDVLTEEEYDAVCARERTSLGALCSKPRGTLGEGGSDAD